MSNSQYDINTKTLTIDDNSTDIPPDVLSVIISSNFPQGSFPLSNFPNITSLHISKSITDISLCWCKDVKSLVNITVSPDNTYFKYIDNKILVGKVRYDVPPTDGILFARRDIEEVTIPSYIQCIFEDAFQWCQKLKKVNFYPDSQLKTIHKCAFEYSGLESISIPPKVSLINYYAFRECRNLKTVDFSQNSELREMFDSFIFTGIEKITIPSSVTSFSGDFKGCNQLKTIIFEPNSPIERLSLSCEESPLDTICIPSNVKYCDFGRIKNLKNIIIPPDSKLREIKSFRNTAIKSITIPQHIEELGSCCFCECRNLKTVIFQLNCKLSYFPGSLFSYSSIEELTIPSSVVEIGTECFRNCSIKMINFPSDSKLRIIRYHVFQGSLIESITIPPQVEEILEGCFVDCKNLKSIDFSKNSRLQEFSTDLFFGSGLESITIPSNINKIGQDSFASCSKLENVYFAPNSKLRTIESGAFRQTAIKSICIPSSVIDIKEFAFKNCPNLITFKIENNPCINFIHESTFTDARSLCFIESIVSSLAPILSLLPAITKKHTSSPISLEITNENVNLDIIAPVLCNVSQITVPNAKAVHLDLDCEFGKLFIPSKSNVKLSGKEINNLKKHSIISLDEIMNLNYLNDNEFKELFESPQNKGKIGEGATSTIYKIASTIYKNKFYALKIFKNINEASNGNDDDDDDDWSDDNEEEEKEQKNTFDFEKVKRFYIEYNILLNLKHRNIIKAYGFFLGNKKYPPAILLDYYSHNLAKSFKKLKEIEYVTIIYEIASAMKNVHESNIIHRDLKPENILLDQKKHVIICDFGISTFINIDTQKRTQSRTHGIGTLFFMAPELYENDKPYNEKVDVYAFGIIMYYILSKGKYPDLSIADVVNKKQINVPNSINEVSSQLIKDCTAFEYNDRPSFEQIVETIQRNDFKLIDGIDDKINEIKAYLFSE